MFMAREAATFPSLQWLTKALQALRNYAGCLFAQHEAENSGCHQVLWLYGEDHQITEAGTMNIFLHWINEDGEEELATPCLDGMILPGVTRQSVLELARKWGELKVTERHLTMIQLCSALKQQQVRDVRLWYCQILFQGENIHIPCPDKDSQLTSRLLKELADIQGSSYLSITPMVDNGTPSFKAADLVVQLTSTPKNNSEVLPFGMGFTDHMLTIEWSAAEGWQAPHIKPFGNLPLHPACSSLHYGIQLFEGLKVFRGDDDRLRIFRPMLNMKRMSNSAKRVCLPAFDQSELLECIRRLVEIDHEWVPHTDSTSLYIRPTFISTEPSLGVRNPSHALLYVIMSQGSSYFSAESLNLWADPKYTRAWKGGTGDCKLGGNYAGCLFAQHEAENSGCHQVLWLYGEDHQITEAGTMNIFLHWINEDGEEELATPCLDGMILPGVTRQSVLELARKWGELKVTERHLTMIQLCSALKQQRVKEMFGCGTAMMMRPIGQILFQGENIHIPCPDKDSQLTSRLLKELADIQNGRTPSDWTVLV